MGGQISTIFHISKTAEVFFTTYHHSFFINTDMPARRKFANEVETSNLPGRTAFEPIHAIAVEPNKFTPPEFLDEFAKQEWYRITATQDECYPVDLAALASYCVQFSHWQKAEVELAGQPLTVSVRGREQANPLVKISENAQKLMLSYARELGFTPVSRTRIPISKEVNDDRDAFTVFMES